MANSPVSDEVMNAINHANLPNGIRNQINAAQIGISPREELMQNISSTTFTKDGYSDELFRRFLNDTTTNKLDSLDFLMLFDPSIENDHIRVAIKVQQTDYAAAQSLINDLRASGNGNENYLKLMESLIIIYNCQDKAYRLNWDTPLKAEIENIAISDPDKRECKNAGALLELLKTFSQPELYEIINPNNVRSVFSAEENINKEQEFSIFPNPGSEYVNIQTPSINSILKFEIYDLSGKIVYTETKFEVDYLMIDISSLSDGMYFVKLNADDVSLNIQKLIIER